MDILERLAQWAENDMKAEAIALEAKYEIERLREAAKDRPKDRPNEAANEIERLREENDELKDLLQCVVNYTGASVSSNRFTFHAALKEGEWKMVKGSE